jgi:hypothetical protein
MPGELRAQNRAEELEPKMSVPNNDYDFQHFLKPAPNQPGSLYEQHNLARIGLARRPRPYPRMTRLRFLETLEKDPAWAAKIRELLRC